MTSRQRMKLGAIPVLLFVLMKTISGPSANDAPSAALVSDAPKIARKTAPAPKSRPRRPQTWPEMTLEDATRHNPFTFSGRQDFDPPGDEELIAAADEETEADLSAYFRSAKGEVALLEGKLIRVGDVVDENWRVVRLSPEGAVLAPAGEAANSR